MASRRAVGSQSVDDPCPGIVAVLVDPSSALIESVKHVCLFVPSLVPFAWSHEIGQGMHMLPDQEEKLRQGAPILRPLHTVSFRRTTISCHSQLTSLLTPARASHDCLHEEDLQTASGSVRAALRGRQLRSPIPPSMFEAINAAKDIHSLAMTTVMDIFDDRASVARAVSSYFAGVNTWFTIIEQVRFEKQLAEVWQSPSAETCVLVLCMSMIARPPEPNPGSGMGDALYHTTKALLNLVQSNVPMSVELLQAELLVAMYEFSHARSQQAYLTLGRCVQMSRAFGWHDKLFWGGNRHPRDLKRCAILWWAIVYVDW